MDAFGVELTDVKADGFAVNVARVDKLDNSGWGMMLRLDYIALLPTTEPKTDEDRVKLAALSYRSANSKIGHTHKHKKVKGEPRSVRVHIPFEPPLLAPTGSEPGMYGAPVVIATMCGEAGQSFPDVHAIVVHGVDAYGFNATVLRVDDLGHGWMSNVRAHWLAWLPRMRLPPTPVREPEEDVSSSSPQPKPEKVTTLSESGGDGGDDSPQTDSSVGAVPTISDTDNTTEHVHSRSSLPSPSQTVNVFAQVANVSGVVRTSGAVVHATVAPKSEQIINFDHLPELPDPEPGSQVPVFAKGGETSSPDGRKWDFVATKPKGVAPDQRQEQGHGSEGRRTLLL